MRYNIYDCCSHDVINRWTCPLVPNMGVSQFKQIYLTLRNNIYKAKTAVLGKYVLTYIYLCLKYILIKFYRSVNLKENIVIADSTHIDEEAYITNSVIGKNCKVGKRVRIMHSYLFDGTVIDEGCNVENSVIGVGVHLQCKSNVASCVLGQHVVIPEKMFVQEKLLLSCDGGNICYIFIRGDCVIGVLDLDAFLVCYI